MSKYKMVLSMLNQPLSKHKTALSKYNSPLCMHKAALSKYKAALSMLKEHKRVSKTNCHLFINNKNKHNG